MPQVIEIPGVGPVEFPDEMNDAQISEAIQANYGKASPERALAQSLADDGADYRAMQEGPTAAGAFGRELGRSVLPGAGGFFSGAATGAGLGAMGANPFTIAAGALIGGIGGAMGTREVQDTIADEVAPESFMGTKSAGADFQSHPVASMLGGALGQGKPAPIRALSVGRNLLTSEGRALIAGGLREGAPAAARVALHDAIDVGTGAGVGAGMSLATGDGMAPESSVLGAIFSRGWLGGRGSQPQPEAPPNENTGLVVSRPEVLRGPVTRMGSNEVGDANRWGLMPRPAGLPAPTDALPAPVHPAGLPAPVDGTPLLPAPAPAPRRVGGTTEIGSGPVIEVPASVETVPQTADSLTAQVEAPRLPMQDSYEPPVNFRLRDGTPPNEHGVFPREKSEGVDYATKKATASVRAAQLDNGEWISTLDYDHRQGDMQGSGGPLMAHNTFPTRGEAMAYELDHLIDRSERIMRDTSSQVTEGQRVEARKMSKWAAKVRDEALAADSAPVPVDPSQPVIPAPTPEAVVPDVPRLEGRQRTMAIGHRAKAQKQLAKLEASGKGDTPQAEKVRNRIGELSAKIGEETPTRKDRTREVFDSDEFPTLNAIRQSGGMQAPVKGIELIQRNRQNKARMSEDSGQKLAEHSEWDDAPGATHYDLGTDGGRLAKDVMGRLYSRDAIARKPDQVAAELGMTTREMWAKVKSELDSVTANNGTRANVDDAVATKAETERVSFEDAIGKYPNKDKGEAGELNKGDTFEIDGEPVRVLSNDGETVKLRDGDRFGVQDVDASELIPMDNLKAGEKKDAPVSAMDRKNADNRELFGDDGGFALSQETTQDGDAIVKAREAKEAAAKAADDAQGKMDFGDAPEERSGILDGLKRHSERVGQSIRKNAGDLNMFTGIPNATMAKQLYKVALDTTIKAIETGDSLRRAIRKGVASLRAHRLGKQTRKEVEARLAADVAAQIRFGRQRDGQMRVEVSRISQEFAAKGNINPTKADLIRELSARFPDQDAYVRKNINDLLDGMMFDRAESAKDSSEWGEWARDMRDRVKDVLHASKETVLEKRVGNVARALHDTLFTGLGEKMHNLAEGKHTGRRSDALKKFARDVFGLKAGEDGVQRVSTDLAAELDSNRMLNPLDEMANDLDKYFRANSIPRNDRAAFKNRIAEHMVDPSRDGELAKQPELKKAVDFFLKRRRERLDYMRSNNVEVGDAGARSASRVMDPMKVMTNRGEFIAAAEKTYRAKWNTEIRELRAEAAKLKQRGQNGDAERFEKIQDKIKELQGRDAKEAAEKYYYAIESGDRGISSDGNDIFGMDGGDKADSIKSREFGPEADEHLGKFMFRDAFDLDAYETTAAVRQVTRARMLATKGHGNEIDRVGKWKQLRKDMEAEGNGDMVPMAAQLIKSYLNLGGSDNPIAQKALEWTHAFTQLAYLSRAGISNLGEPVLIGLRSGRVGDMVKAYRESGRNLARRLRKMAPNESQILADALGIAKGGMNSLMGAARMQDAFGGRGKLGKLVSSFHVKTLLTDMTHAMHEASMEIGRGFIHAELRIAKGNGPTSRLSRKNLAEVGIGQADIDRMVKFTERISKAPDKVKVILEDSADAKLYRDALTLFSRSGAVLDPTRGGRAQYANSPVGGLFYSLQSFLYEFHAKILKRHASRVSSAVTGKMDIGGKTETLTSQERSKIALEVMAGISAVYSAQFGVQMIREYVFSDPERIAKDKRRTGGEILAQRAQATISRTGIFGPYDLLFNMVTGARFQREPATVVLGPAIGGFSELFGATVNVFNEDRNTPNTNTAERKLARTAYNLTVAPALGALSATMPGRLIPGAIIQGAYHPGTREAAVRGVAGPPIQPGGPMRRKKQD